MTKQKNTIAMIGGDMRELVVAQRLAEEWPLQVYGLPEDALPLKAVCCHSLTEALTGADVVLLPMGGVRSDFYIPASTLAAGNIPVTVEDFSVLKPGTPVLAGVVSPALQQIGDAYGLRLVPVAERDDIAVPNAIPTAEGAIEIAMRELPVTIHGLQVLILGYGRIGKALASRLQALGAHVTVANRLSDSLRQAQWDGYDTCLLTELEAVLPKVELLCNTIPTPLLGPEQLERLFDGACIIDLATVPAVDLAAAETLHLNVFHALGLPGKVAPVTAGRLLAAAYPNIIRQLEREQAEKQETEVQ